MNSLRTTAARRLAAVLMSGRYSNYSPPANPMALYQTLAANRPVLIQLASGSASTHVVVARGMSFVQTPFGPEAVLHVNDPMAVFTQPVPFSRIAPIWIDAVVVH